MRDVEQNLVAWMRGQGMHDSAGLVERVIAERDAAVAWAEKAEAECDADILLAKEISDIALIFGCDPDGETVLECVLDMKAERDALRELLREALAYLKTGQWAVPTDITLLSRIDAALNKGGGDE